MKSQSFKLFAIAFVLGLVTIFGAAASAGAQTRSTFETSFDFHVGKEKHAAGTYELQRLGDGKYLLRNAETKKSRIVYFDQSQRNDAPYEQQRVLFNRYGNVYFLRCIVEEPLADGRVIIESSYEKQIRRNGATGRENQLAKEKAQPEKVSVNLSK